MDSNNLNILSNNLYMLLLSLNKSIFNPGNIIKDDRFPPSHLKVLIHLTYYGPNTMSKMATKLTIAKPNMTPIIDKLVDEGYLYRFQDPNDRRSIRIDVTDKAKNYLKEFEHSIKLSLAEKLSDLDSNDLDKLQDSISIMSEIISKLQKK